MCPDTQLHSAFYDGEIPAPWSNQFAAHAEKCPKCAAKLASYKRITDTLQKASPECSPEFLNTSFSQLIKKMEVANFSKRNRSFAAPAGFVPVKMLKFAVAAVFVITVLPASFFLGKAAAERELSATVPYYALMQSQQKSTVAFPPQQNESPLEFTITGRQVSSPTQVVPVFKPGHGIVMQERDNQSPMIIIRLPNPDFSPFAEDTVQPIQSSVHK